jgi:GntR family transcriptional regulator, rspAB operon transcriptional repressor
MNGTTATVPRGKLADRAYRYLRDGILRGDLPPGTVLAETELAETIGGSRTPIRQALGRLLQEGLIEVGPRRQSIVRGFTPEHRREMVLLREALESVAVRRACEVMAIDQIDELRILLIRQRRAAADGDNDEFLDLDEQLHLRIAEGARLPILHAFLSQLRGFVRVARYGPPRPPLALAEIVDEHERLLDALESRDVDAALRALTEHLERSDYAAAVESARA